LWGGLWIEKSHPTLSELIDDGGGRIGLNRKRVALQIHTRPMLPDPNDEMVLETAINGRADAIVTFNGRDLEMPSGQERIAFPTNIPTQFSIVDAALSERVGGLRTGADFATRFKTRHWPMRENEHQQRKQKEKYNSDLLTQIGIFERHKIPLRPVCCVWY
jgi:hypothetical protein